MAEADEQGMNRATEFLISAIALCILLVPLICTALVVRFTSTGPAIYWSTRIGRFERPFKMPKFRTMNTNAPLKPTDSLDNPEYHITSVGHFLRKSSIDELPQLYCVLVGDMSIVGPRPVLPMQSELLEMRRQAGVHVLRPGITGWAQVNGRDDLGTSDKVRLDAEYLAKRSLFFDLKIIWLTAVYVTRSRGVWH